MKSPRNLLIGSALAAAALIALLALGPPRRPAETTGPLVVLCAAGLKPPVEASALAFERELGIPVQLQYGGSGTLLANAQVSGRGDLFLAADESYLRAAIARGLVAEVIPLARMTAVIAVKKGNPKAVRSLADLLRPDVSISLASPEAAAVGTILRDLLQKSGGWDALSRKTKVFKPTVMDVTNDVKLGAVDAAVVWDANVRQNPDLDMVQDPRLEDGGQTQVSVGVLNSSRAPTAALRLARYLGAPGKGLAELEKNGYRPVEGDAWEESPQAVLFSGAMNRLALEETLRRFEEREGARVTRVYNGCGILVSQMKAGQRPDAYLACDLSFMGQVSELFLDPLNVSRASLVILTARGNPREIRSLDDLARPGLRVGIANPEQSALGDLTVKVLDQLQLREPVLSNVKVQTPTADLLVNQMRAGGLDAAVVYTVSVSQARDELAVVPIEAPAAEAVQPYAVRKGSPHRRLMERLLRSILSPESRKLREALGFQSCPVGE